MVRPVLSGTCPVKPLYGLGHCAAAQFQGLGNLLIAYTSGWQQAAKNGPPATISGPPQIIWKVHTAKNAFLT